MSNDNLKNFRAQPLDGSPTYIIAAVGFEVEADSHATIFYDETDRLVARLFNVSVTPLSTSRESSSETVLLAQTYLRLTPERLAEMVADDAENTCADIKGLAGSVLSQAGKD
jgi:hypothetical protein